MRLSWNKKVKKAGKKKYIPHDGGISSTLMLDESARAIFDNHENLCSKNVLYQKLVSPR